MRTDLTREEHLLLFYVDYRSKQGREWIDADRLTATQTTMELLVRRGLVLRNLSGKKFQEVSTEDDKQRRILVADAWRTVLNSPHEYA